MISMKANYDVSVRKSRVFINDMIHPNSETWIVS